MRKAIPAMYNACLVCKFSNLDSMNPETGQPVCKLHKTIPSDYGHADRLMKKGGIMAICHFSSYKDTMLKRLRRDCIGARPIPN